MLARAPQFEEALTFCTIDPRAITAARLRDTRHRANVRRQRRAGPIAEPPVFTLASLSTETASGAEVVSGDVADTLSEEAEVYAALRTGLHDYVEKNGFEHVVIALSGGIDSALVALVAADALGPERVTCVSMPSPYSSEGTRNDARTIAENLGVDFREIGIEQAMQRLRGDAERGLRGPRAGRGRGERAGAHPRQRGDGALEQVRLARAHDRQQVGAVGGLRDALRRHGRRLRRAEGRLQDLGLPAGALAQRAGGPRAGAGIGARPPALGRAAPRAARRGLASPLRRARPHPRGLHRGRPRRRRAGAPRPAGRGRGARDPDGRPRRVQAPPGAARDQDLHARLRARPAAADHEPLRDARRIRRAARSGRFSRRARPASPATWRRAGRRRR